MIKAFERYLLIQNKSPHTVSNYLRDLQAFAAFYQAGDECERGDDAIQEFDQWQAVDAEAIRSFLAQRMQAGISARTLSRQLSSLRTFFDFLVAESLLTRNPAKSVKAPKQPQPLPKSLDVDWTQRLLEQPLETWQDVRDQAVFELLYSAGLRVSECAELDVGAGVGEIESGWVRVIGKGMKERLAPVGSKALMALQNWLAIRAQYADSAEKALFVSRNGSRLSVRSIQKALDKRALKAGLPTKMSPHRLRHACATHVLESSGDLRAVQEILGHANLSTTQIYTKLDLQHLAQVYDQAHPRAKKSSDES